MGTRIFSKGLRVGFSTLCSVSLLACLGGIANAGTIPDESVRQILEPITGATVTIHNEGNCELMRIDEDVPGGDGLDRVVKYDVSKDCFVGTVSGDVKPSAKQSMYSFRSALADSCRRTYAVQTIKDPINLTVSKLTMNGTRCWNGKRAYFSSPRGAYAEAPLAWNSVIQNAYFTSYGDTYGSSATLSATARFNSKWVECGISQGKNYSMTNRLNVSATGKYSAGFSHDLPCGRFIHVESTHYEQ